MPTIVDEDKAFDMLSVRPQSTLAKDCVVYRLWKMAMFEERDKYTH